MSEKEHTYIAIDLKSFYASVECVERNLDPLTTNLVVADESRSSKTICLAVSPSLKAFGISGRPRLFEVEQKVSEINRMRRRRARGGKFSGSSYSDPELKKDSSLELTYVTAVPRMAFYIEYSSRIYNIYLKYIAPEDIHVYSIDEVFIDATHYLKTYQMSAHELAMTMIRDVLKTTGITATAGIGTNLYLAKVAMDIVAKHIPADQDGVRIAELDEMSYRRSLWSHTPLTDFWRIGRGIARRLEQYGIHTMGDLARVSLTKDEMLYKEFGVIMTIGIYALYTGDTPMAHLQNDVIRTVNSQKGVLQTHAFFFYEDRNLVTIDVVTDDSVRDENAFVQNINDLLLRSFPGYNFSIVIDHNYS
jgi:DNA polymerase V